MKHVPRILLRRILGSVSRRPKLKRAIVDLAYRLPWVDTRLRDLVYRVEHPDAVLDVDPARLPEGSRQTLARIRARTPQ